MSLNNLVDVTEIRITATSIFRIESSLPWKYIQIFHFSTLWRTIVSLNHPQIYPRRKRFSHLLDGIESGADKGSQDCLWKEESMIVWRKKPWKSGVGNHFSGLHFLFDRSYTRIILLKMLTFIDLSLGFHDCRPPYSNHCLT